MSSPKSAPSVNVLVIGSINMDVLTPLRRLPEPGETIHVEDISLVPGGKGANTAVAAARQGATVRFIGCVGDDAFGKQLRSSLEDDHIDCRLIRTSTRGTGTAVILLDRATGQNAIMVGPGANDEVVLPKNDEVFKWADIVLLQLETPLSVNIEAAVRAREFDLPVILDPAPAQADLPDALLKSVTITSPNESELSMLTGKRVDSIDAAEAAARLLLDRGCQQIVVKLGEKGALWVTQEHAHHVAAPVIEAIDTTAAGDAFTGTLGVGLAAGLDMPTAMNRACHVGALTCTQLGAQPSIPDLKALTRFKEAMRVY